MSALYWYYKNTVLRFVRYRLVFDNLILKFISIYSTSAHSDKNSTIFFRISIVTGEFTILILKKNVFKVCVVLFGFYSSHFKFRIHLPCINTQQQTTAPFDDTPVILSGNQWTEGLYQGPADCCEGDHNSDIIRLLQQYQKIHYCNQSVLAIVPDLNIFVFSITIVDLISRSALVRFSLLCVGYLYNFTGLRFYIFCS